MDKNELENFKEFGDVVDKLTKDSDYLVKVIEAFDRHEPDRFKDLLEERKLWRYCRWICWWICYVRCYPVCSIVCR